MYSVKLSSYSLLIKIYGVSPYYCLILKNGNKARLYVNNTALWKRRSISESISSTSTSTRPHFRQPKSPFPVIVRNHLKDQLSVSLAAATNTKGGAFSLISYNNNAAGLLVGWYLGLIKTRPILTKSITSALIFAAADFSSQTIARSSECYDFIRSLRMGGFGMIVAGPSLHYWFNFMSRLYPTIDLVATFKKIFVGHAIYGPIMTAVFFSINAGIQGESGSEIVARLKRDLIPTLINSVMYWTACDFIIFRFIPVHLQPLGNNLFSYIWTIYATNMASLEKAGTSCSVLPKSN